jgi:hypothetical protein
MNNIDKAIEYCEKLIEKWYNNGEIDDFDICDIIEHDGCIGLDACTAWTHKVNVLTLEDNFLED